MTSEPIERSWTPLRAGDYAVLVFAGLWQLFALAVCFHLYLNRRWPPYVTKNVTLVIVTGVSGVLWLSSMTISWGYWNRQPGDFLAQCELEVFFSWASVSLHAAAFMIRPYRVWKLLVKHDGKMWATEYQILMVSSVALIPSLVAWLENSSSYDYDTNFCGTDGLSKATSIFMNMLALAMFVFLWCVCVRELRGVRKQYNEYESLTWSLLATSLMLVTYPIIITFLLWSDPVFQRRLSLLYPIMTTYVLFWGPIREPFSKKMMRDQQYLLTFTRGFSTLPTPAQLKASLAEQLSIDQLRAEFRKYIKTKIAQELIDFYQDSLDREEVSDFEERQAVTMRIIDQFIRVGSKDQVNLSEECRERVLETDAKEFTIFDEARSEVLRIMETNFHYEFSSSVGFRRIADAAEREAKEFTLLKAEGVMPRVVTDPAAEDEYLQRQRSQSGFSSRNSLRRNASLAAKLEHSNPSRPSSVNCRNIAKSVSWRNRISFARSSASIGDDEIEVTSAVDTHSIGQSQHSTADGPTPVGGDRAEDRQASRDVENGIYLGTATGVRGAGPARTRSNDTRFASPPGEKRRQTHPEQPAVDDPVGRSPPDESKTSPV